MPFFRIAQTAILAGKEPNKLQGTCTLIIYTPTCTLCKANKLTAAREGYTYRNVFFSA